MNQKIFNCPHCGKIISKDQINQKTSPKKVKCPECGSLKTWKDGKRKTPQGQTQRYLCKECYYRFSEQ